MRKYLLGISAAAIAALLVGCGSSDTGASHQMDETSAESTGGAGQAEHNDQDITFAQGMIPHHRQAIDMAEVAAEKASSAEVNDLAGRIKAAQDPEIQQLTDMLEKWGAPTEPSESSMPGMDHGETTGGMDHGGMSGEGMMTDEEMRRLEGATGAEFDRMWVQMMIKHHQGAVDMSKTELAQGSDAEAKDLAQKIIDTQEAEIKEMRGLSL
jgi:uncharacterized protein (DUF305 family)